MPSIRVSTTHLPRIWLIALWVTVVAAVSLMADAAPATGADGVASLAVGGSHSCALRDDGSVTCWGWNADGRLGDGTFGERHLPVEVVGLGDKVTATPTPTPHTAIGDVDCDGVVDAIDAALVLQFEAGLLGELGCAAAGDVNGDGEVDAIDAALVLQFEAGLLGSLN